MSRILVVGAGLSGATLAERFAQSGAQVLVLDKKAHLAGNCYDYLDVSTGIRVSQYGAHLFHTNSQQVWHYLQQFAQWRSYQHQVLVKVGKKLLNLPVNLNTVNQFFDLQLSKPSEMRRFLATKIKAIKQVNNGEDYLLSTLGKELYEAIFENYTLKQWALPAKELDPAVVKRNPLRFNRDNRYFTDRYQALPMGGFTDLVNNMLNHPNIKLELETDFFSWRNTNNLQQFDLVFYSGAIDQYFDYAYGQLEYRSLDFHFSTLKQEFYQNNAVINYPAAAYPFTRIIEYKHIYPPKKAVERTIIAKEFPTWVGEPYYPVPRPRNQQLFKQYQQQARQLAKKGIYFVGRLGTYRYINMDQAVAEALSLFERVKNSNN